MNFWLSVYEAVYPRRRPVVLAVYAALAGAAYAIAYLLRFEFAVPAPYVQVFLRTLVFVMAVRAILAGVFGLMDGRWRYVGMPDVVRLTGATVFGTALLFFIGHWLPGLPIPRSVLLLEMLLTFQATAALWVAYRLGFEQMRHARSPSRQVLKPVIIVGAGEAGVLLAREIMRTPTGYRLVGMVDDDRLKRGTRVHGVTVLGGTKDIAALVRDKGVEELIIAIPSASPERLRELVEACEETNVPFKVLPGIREVMRGQVGVSQLRELKIEDLLGREPIQLELPELTEDLEGNAVLVTGAAGSIGSELSRQIALHSPRELILFDQAETELFYLNEELRRTHPELSIVPVIGDITCAADLDQVMERYAPSRVFHAAAYKHVPMMESNPEQAIRNNVIGTYRVAVAAARAGAGKFVLVSTDKAVRPANVMGATKRLAELVVLALQEQYPTTSFGAVRFGNVLGSAGSVIPIFRRQLRDGQPLTVTHADATRFFMTIPEAVQLILQASLLPELRGHIAMLDMGEPVRITDLARNFLRLSGRAFRPGQTVVFTGLRPGEKLHEELSEPGEAPIETSVPKVHMLHGRTEAAGDVLALVRDWVEEDTASSEMLNELASMYEGLSLPPAQYEPQTAGSADARVPASSQSAA